MKRIKFIILYVAFFSELFLLSPALANPNERRLCPELISDIGFYFKLSDHCELNLTMDIQSDRLKCIRYYFGDDKEKIYHTYKNAGKKLAEVYIAKYGAQICAKTRDLLADVLDYTPRIIDNGKWETISVGP